MKKLTAWIQKHSFILYSIIFLLMAIPPIGLYFSAQNQAQGWSLLLLALVGAANFLVLFLR